MVLGIIIRHGDTLTLLPNHVLPFIMKKIMYYMSHGIVSKVEVIPNLYNYMLSTIDIPKQINKVMSSWFISVGLNKLKRRMVNVCILNEEAN